MSPTTKATTRTTNRTGRDETARGFSSDERSAMKDRGRELKAARSQKGGAEDSEGEVLAKIGAMQGSDRAIAERLHALVKASAPALTPRLWYGMPAYAKDGKVLCFFQPAQKFKSRYAMLGFSDEARLDEGALWPVYFALADLGSAEEERIAELLATAAR